MVIMINATRHSQQHTKREQHRDTQTTHVLLIALLLTSGQGYSIVVDS